MHTVTYTPAPCEGEDAEFKGEVVLRAPSYEDRLEMAANPALMDYLKQQEAPEKKKKRDDDSQAKADQVKMMIAMVKWSYGFYEKVDITRIKDGVRFTDVEKLRHDPSCGGILQDCATKLSQGFELGN